MQRKNNPTDTSYSDLPQGCRIEYFKDRLRQAYTLWVPTFHANYSRLGTLRVWSFWDTEEEAREAAYKAAGQRRRKAAVA